MTPTRSALSLIAASSSLVVASSCVAACDACGSSPSSTSSAGTNPDAAGGAEDVPSDVAAAGLDAALPCSGSAIDLAAVVSDPACAITSGIAKSTRAIFEMAVDAGKHSLKQEATRLEDGRVEVRLTNRGTLPAALPLSWHPKIPAFIVLADNPKERALYELEAPALSVDLDGGPASARFARVTITPGGYAFARVKIDPKIVRRAGKTTPGTDAGPTPSKLADGKWMLHIGQLVTDIDTGEPAKVPFVIEATD